MANRYWVGGSGTWDGTSTTNWSATSGGAAGASAPTIADAAFIDANSGAGTINTTATATALNIFLNASGVTLVLGGNITIGNQLDLVTGDIDLNGFDLTSKQFFSSYSSVRSLRSSGGKFIFPNATSTSWNTATITNLTLHDRPFIDTNNSVSSGAFGEAVAPDVLLRSSNSVAVGGSVNDLDLTNFSGTLVGSVRTVYGDLTISAATTLSTSTSTTTFAGTSGTKSITSSGKTLDFPLTFNGAGSTWVFVDDLSVGATRTVTLTNGVLDANGKNVMLGSFALGSGTKTLMLGSGTWTVAGANWNSNTNVTGLTVSPSTGVISMTSASAKTFAGGGKTWPTLNQGGAGALTIQQANTFANITNTVQSATITFPASTTTTVSAFGVSGISGNLITLNSSSAGTRATLSDASGVNSVSFCNIKDINATGGATWSSFTSNGNVDSGNNVGWNFFAQAFRYLYTRRKNKVIYPL